MMQQLLQEWMDLWREGGVTLEQGLSDTEIASIEADYGFHFPPDLRAVLQEAQPTSDRFVDWRNTHSAGLRGLLREPVEGVLDTVKELGFWYPQWGPRPTNTAAAVLVAREGLQAAPTLIPFWGGAYIPDDPPEEGNPLFLVHDSDIVLSDESLLLMAKRVRPGSEFHDQIGPGRYIRLWSDFVSWPGIPADQPPPGPRLLGPAR